MKEIIEFLKSCGVFYIATADGDQPRVRPFGALCEFEGKIYLITGKVKEVYKQLVKDPKLEISGMTKDGRWLRLAAEAVFDERREAKKAMLDANPDLRRLYSEDDGNIAVFYLKNASASVCSFTAPPVKYEF